MHYRFVTRNKLLIHSTAGLLWKVFLDTDTHARTTLPYERMASCSENDLGRAAGKQARPNRDLYDTRLIELLKLKNLVAIDRSDHVQPVVTPFKNAEQTCDYACVGVLHRPRHAIVVDRFACA